MATAIRPITREDVRPLHDITVRPDQQSFIAPNAVTIAQTRFETGAYDFCIWDDDTRVGLIALIDRSEIDAGFIWRLLIGTDFQGQGHGTQTIKLAESWARDKERRVMQIQAVHTNATAIKLYETLGYVLTGKMDGDEVQLEKLL